MALGIINKRNADGSISTIHWYARAIDEIEGITYSAYNTFSVFQDKFYWSCQPSYNVNRVTLNGYNMVVQTDTYTDYIQPGKKDTHETTEQITPFDGNGKYQTDDLHRARATKIDNDGNNIESGLGSEDYSSEMQLAGEYRYYITYNHEQKSRKVWGYTVYYMEYDLIPDFEEDPDPECDYEISPLNTSIDYNNYPGNLPRTGVKNRVRCVYSKEGIAL